jgi:phytoene dehydrogenase-like protein
MDKTAIVIGGGISGLVSAALLGRAGVPAVLLEKASTFGGRAATRERKGFQFNLGPHALYRRGIFRQTLKDLGVDVRGAIPAPNGGFGIADGRLHTLPTGLTSMLTTGALGLAGKLEFARLYARLPGLDASTLQRQGLATWLDAQLPDPSARRLLEMLVRVTTFTNDPERQSAGAAIEQLQLAVKGNVLYLDGGWQTIVDGLRNVALAAGVRIESDAAVVAFEKRDDRTIEGVRLANGSVIRGDAFVIAATPGDAESLLDGSHLTTSLPSPVRVATLDIGLASLPKPTRAVAFGLDAPLYFSVHSAVARLAPAGGAVIHVAKYLRPDETAGRETEHDLQAVMDLMQPGWRSLVEVRQFLPNLVVTHAELTAAIGGAAGRPATSIDGVDNVFVAGDWVGPRGQLSDAAAASAADAARAVRQMLMPRSAAA